jgi:hypothetical protein
LNALLYRPQRKVYDIFLKNRLKPPFYRGLTAAAPVFCHADKGDNGMDRAGKVL